MKKVKCPLCGEQMEYVAMMDEIRNPNYCKSDIKIEVKNPVYEVDNYSKWILVWKFVWQCQNCKDDREKFEANGGGYL